MTTIPLEPVDGVHITVLMDNVSDSLLLDQGPAKRVGLASSEQPPRVRAPLLEGGESLDALLAEHGFSALISVTKDGREHRVLFDDAEWKEGLLAAIGLPRQLQMGVEAQLRDRRIVGGERL